jgi:signal transduction histidine kinase
MPSACSMEIPVKLNACSEESRTAFRDDPGHHRSVATRASRSWYASATEIEARKQEEERVRQENVRLEERTRIARELHDTLLQTCLGTLCQLGAAVESLPPDSQVKSRFDPILQFMEQGIEEGRDAIQSLRSSGARPLNLVVALSAVHQQFSAQPDADFRVSVVGQQQPLRSAIQQEIYHLGRDSGQRLLSFRSEAHRS